MSDTVLKSEEQEDDILGMRMPLKMRCRTTLKSRFQIKGLWTLRLIALTLCNICGLWYGFLAGQSNKSFPAHEGIEECDKCRYKSSLRKHLKDHNKRTHLGIKIHCPQFHKLRLILLCKSDCQPIFFKN